MFSLSTRRLFDQEKKVEAATYVELLKQRASELEEELWAVRMRVNSYSLPNRLPTEVLEKVFMEHVLDANSDRQDKDNARWVGIAQVCRHWRDVALNYALLWTTIIPSHPEFMKLLLARSKREPVDFTVNSSHLEHVRQRNKVEATCQFVTDMLSQIHRFRSLAVYSYGWPELSSVHALLSKASGHAPNLIELHITCGGSWDSIPSDFLEGGAPVLQLLELISTPISWTRIPLPSTLTSLSLSNGMQLPSVSEFYNSFSELNALRDLKIVHWLPSSDDSRGLPLSPPPFALASLKAVRVEDCSESVTRFFSIIRTPEIVSMNVTFSESHISGIAIMECIENIRAAVDDAMKNFQNISEAGLCHFKEKEPFGKPASVVIRYEPLSEIPSQHNLPHLGFDFSNQQLHLPEILTSINKAFGFATAKTLHINSCKDIDPRLLLEMFSSSPKLRELVFTSTPVSGFFQKMGEDPALQSDGLEPYFPALSSITLRSIRCADDEDAEERGGEGIDTGGATRTLWEGGLLECISTALGRRADAYRVRKLVLKECKNLGQKEFGRLCGSMSSRTDVFWDGLESWGTRAPLEVNGEDSSDSDLGPYDSDDAIF